MTSDYLQQLAAARPTVADITADWQVVVIGAGVTGGLAAINCVRAGLQTLLIERQPLPRPKVCGCCLNARAVALLQSAGIAEPLRQLARPISVTRFHVRGRSAAVRVPGTQAVSRAALDGILAAQFLRAGGTLLTSVAASVSPDQALPTIELQQPDSAGENLGRTIRAQVLLVCDGLGHPSLKRLPQIISRVAKRARIGLGTVIPREEADGRCYPDGQLQMAVGPSGYVGTVNIENQQLNIAAAVDAGLLKQGRSPAQALQQIYADAGLPIPAKLQTAEVRGTRALTRTTLSTVPDRMFLLGDAAGYVEPITGEGMTWGLTAAQQVLPLVQQAIGTGWDRNLHAQWNRLVTRHVRRRQRFCRLLAGSLRFPWLHAPLLTATRLFPGIGQSVVSRMNQSSATGQTPVASY